MKKLVVLALVFCGLSAAGSLKDARDGKTYKTIEIDGLEWMTQNLDYKDKSSVCYDKKEKNCKSLGRLYAWDEAVNACPEGWRLPTKDEFESLLKNAGGSHAKNFFDGDGEDIPLFWEGVCERMMDKSFFAIQLAGFGMAGKMFSDKGTMAELWSATAVDDAPIAYRLELDFDGANVYTANRTNNNSVRCVKD